MSLSARRAWIEISALLAIHTKSRVALRKESVDRNGPFPYLTNYHFTGSLSARRAWIEIARTVFVRLVNGGRSPQGERG